jgi:mxaA protein
VAVRCLIVAFMIFADVAAAAAQVRSVKLVTPRLFGYFVGDRIPIEVDVVVDKNADLVPASLPQPGPLNAWLEIIGSRVEEESAAGDGKLYRVYVDYQNFYPALDSRSLDVPGFALSFTSGGKTLTADAPGWSFLISPLREVQPPAKAAGADYMQPDARPRRISLYRYSVAALGLVACCLAAFALLAYHLAWWPFTARPRRPFTTAARRIRQLLDTRSGGAGYRDALLTLHRAIDATAGHAVFAEDLPEFLDHLPAFSPLKEDFDLFFRSSRQVFFSNKTDAAAAGFGPGKLGRFSDQLASVERMAQ